MLRFLCWVLPMLLCVGCVEPIERAETSDTGDASSVGGTSSSPSGIAAADGDIRGLLDQLKAALEKRDWQAVRKLHWSGMKETSDDLKQAYEGKLDRLGEVGEIASRDFQPMNEETYQKYMDKEELPGPVELLTGSIEFEIPSQSGQPVILVWIYTCKEEGVAKIFGYIDLSLE